MKNEWVLVARRSATGEILGKAVVTGPQPWVELCGKSVAQGWARRGESVEVSAEPRDPRFLGLPTQLEEVAVTA